MARFATLQHLRSFDEGDHPPNLEPGQIAFNLSQENQNPDNNDLNTWLYIGNGSNKRVDEGGRVLYTGGSPNKGWIRYRLRNVSVDGDNIYGDLTIHGSKLKVEANGSQPGELVVPKAQPNADGSEIGSIRWNSIQKILQSWDGNKWDSTAKVNVGYVEPSEPSEGDMWLDLSVNPPALKIFITRFGGQWVPSSTSASDTALQPGNGVTSNDLNQIQFIDTGSY